MICSFKSLQEFLTTATAYSQITPRTSTTWCRKGLCVAPRSSLPYLLVDVVNSLHNAVELCTKFADGDCTVATIANKVFVVPFVEIPHEVVPPLEVPEVAPPPEVLPLEMAELKYSAPYLLTFRVGEYLVSYRLRRL